MNSRERNETRLFIGIPLSDEVRKELITVTDLLKGTIDDVRWVKPENLHVTIKFLGNTSVDIIPGIVDVLCAVSKYLPLEMEVGGVGAFSSQASARVIWVKAYDESGSVIRIYEEIENGMRKLGFPREKRKYYPHITIGRSKKKPVKLNAEMIEGIDSKCRLMVDKIVLFKSELKSSGAEYLIINEVGRTQGDSKVQRGCEQIG